MEKPLGSSRCGYALISLAVALTFSLTFLLRSGYSYGAVLLLLVSIGMLRHSERLAFPLFDRSDRWLLGIFILYGLSFVFFRLYHVFELTGLDKPSRFVAVALLFVGLRRCRFSLKWMWYGLAIGAISGFILGGYEHWVQGHARAGAHMNPIMFGDINMLFGLLCLVGIWFFKAAKSNRGMIFMAIGGGCGIFASFLSGSRGGWIAMPMAVLYIFWQARELIGLRRVKIIFLAFFLLLGTIVSIPQMGVSHRIEQAVSNIEQYTSGVNVDTSVGMRFEMWKAAVYLFAEHPVLGVGKYDLKLYKQQLANRGLISQSVVRFDHAHNELLTNLSEYGVVGLILLLLVYGIPIRLFAQKVVLHRDNWQLKSLAMAGVLIPVSFIDFALTQSMFSHNSGVMIYVLAIIIFWAAIRNLEYSTIKE